MKKKIHELKMKLYEWRKRIIEEKYFKTFPERKQIATIEIRPVHVTPVDYYKKVALDPMTLKEELPDIQRYMARDLGEELLEKGMIDICSTTFDPYFGGTTLIATIRVCPPIQKGGAQGHD